MSLKKKAVEGVVEGAAVEVSKAAVGWALLADLSWAGGVVVIAKEAVIEPIATHPLAFFAVFVFGGLFGFAIGMIIRYVSLKKRIDRENEVASLEAEINRLKKKIESEESEACRKFESLNLGQSDMVSLAHGERNGFRVSADSKKLALARKRKDVFEIDDHAESATVFLTPEWNTLMNEHGDMFHEIWNPRKADAYAPRVKVE